MRRGALIVVLLTTVALAQDVDALLGEGQRALEKKDAEGAVRALERARAGDTRRADVAYWLARGYVELGKNGDAVRYFREVVKLDPDGLGKQAEIEHERVRKRQLKIELEGGEEDLRNGQLAKARLEFERAFDLALAEEVAKVEQARRGQLAALCAELAKTALASGTGAQVALAALAAPGGGEAARLVPLVEEELAKRFRAGGAEVLLVARGQPVPDTASVTVTGALGQQLVLRVTEKAKGTLVASATARALVKDQGTLDLPPETVKLELSIEAERDDPARPGTPDRIAVAEGSELRSGDRFRLVAKTDRDAYLYVFIFDAQGQATLLYPRTEELFPDLKKAKILATNPVRGAERVFVPPLPREGKPYWFYLDETVGTETFYVAASLVPLEDVEKLVGEIQLSGEKGSAARRRLAKGLRGRAGESRVAAEGHVELIEGRGAVVRWISVEHQ